MRTMVAILGVVGAAATHAHAKPGAVYFPAVSVSEPAKELEYLTSEVAINDFPLADLRPAVVCTKDGPNYCLGQLKNFRRVHPYFLRNGANSVRVAYGVGKSQGDGPFVFAFDVQLASSTDPTHWTLGAVLAHIETPPFAPDDDSDKRAAVMRSFQFDAKLPAWHWQSSTQTIHDNVETRRNLLTEYEKIWKTLDAFAPGPAQLASGAQKSFEAKLRADTAEFIKASKLARPSEDTVAGLLDHARHRNEKVPLGLRPLPEFEPMHMDVFAGGKLARLKYYNAELIRFQGGAHDAPRGHAGPVEYAYDLWFRLDDKAHWQLDAIVPVREE